MQVLRSARVVPWMISGTVATALAVTGVLTWQDLGAGWLNEHGALMGMLCGLGAVGVMVLGWRLDVLIRAVTSTVERLRPGSPAVLVAERYPVHTLREVLSATVESAGCLHAQVNDLQIQTQALNRQRRQAEAVLHSIHHAVLVVDEHDRVLFANPAAAEVFRFDWPLSSLQQLADVVGQDQRILVDWIRQSRRGRGETTRCQIEFNGPSAARIFEGVASGLREEGASPGCLVVVLNEVTREKEISQMKSDFVSYVSHELKTPLASITAYAEMLADGEADDEHTRNEFCGVIQGQAKRLHRLIEEILNLSRIESGLIQVRKEPVSLALLVEDQVRMLRSYAEERHVRIIGTKPIVYDQVCADKDMMSQVILNLLSNAVKYNTPGGSVTVETEVDEAASLVRLSVKDTGVGIPAEEVDRVFEKFYRAKANQNRAEGTGLGLSLVKQIVEKMHGGRVFVQSQVGAGSTFGFELPSATRTEVAGRYGWLGV